MRAAPFVLALLFPVSALADDRAEAPTSRDRPTVAHEAAPIHGFTYSAKPAAALGAATFGSTVARDALFGGRVFGSPIDRLIVIGEAQRAFDKQFVPSLAAIVRLYGGDGLVIGALGKAKARGFSGAPEVEAEAEVGAIVGYHRARIHFDANAIAGSALGDEREIDTEARLRVGYDVLGFLRIGIDGQARVRLVGDQRLPGDRTWDWVVGPQILASYRWFYAAASAGPATFGYAGRGVGFLTSLTIGATTL